MDVDDDDVVIASTSAAGSSSTAQPATSSGFAPLSSTATSGVLKNEFRRIPIPPHRFNPLQRDWLQLYTPLVDNLGLQVRMNPKRRCVELKTSEHTVDTGAVQKGADFVKAYALGFDVNVSNLDTLASHEEIEVDSRERVAELVLTKQDALALLRLDDMYLDSFEIKDVKTLHGDHLSRAIGRFLSSLSETSVCHDCPWL